MSYVISFSNFINPKLELGQKDCYVIPPITAQDGCY